jgi:AbrB family looped-hinge helix DNA binding protein
MIAELRAKSQITVPREIVAKLGLSKGDKLEVFERDGTICLMPVVVYPKKYVEALEREASETADLVNKGELKVYSSAEELIESLHTDAHVTR